MNRKIIAIFLIAFTTIAGCAHGVSSTEYVTSEEFNEYKRKREEEDTSVTEKQLHNVLRHYKMLAKIEHEACRQLNGFLADKSDHLHCVEVQVVGRTQKGWEGFVVLRVNRTLKRAPVILGWDMRGRLQVFPGGMENSKNLSSWDELL